MLEHNKARSICSSIRQQFSDQSVFESNWNQEEIDLLRQKTIMVCNV